MPTVVEHKLLSALCIILALAATIALIAGCSAGDSGAAAPTPEQLTVKVVKTLPYAPQTFTEGLVVDGDYLLVSAGMEGRSSLSRRDIATGEVVQQVDLDPQYFGEGITRVGDTIWQMTYQDGIAFRYDAQTFALTGQAHYTGEGWGLCSFNDSDPATMYMSDGTAELRVLNAADFSEQSRVTVTDSGTPVTKINELSCAPDGTLYANVFLTDWILKIDPTSGAVLARIDASALRPAETKGDINAVLNGIAHIPGTDRFYVTGKDWTVMYEVEFVTA